MVCLCGDYSAPQRLCQMRFGLHSCEILFWCLCCLLRNHMSFDGLRDSHATVALPAVDADELLAAGALTSMRTACCATTVVAEADGFSSSGAKFAVEALRKSVNVRDDHGPGRHAAAAGSAHELRSVYFHGQLVWMHADLECDGFSQVFHWPCGAHIRRKANHLPHYEDREGVFRVNPQPQVHLRGQAVSREAALRPKQRQSSPCHGGILGTMVSCQEQPQHLHADLAGKRREDVGRVVQQKQAQPQIRRWLPRGEIRQLVDAHGSSMQSALQSTIHII